LAHAAREHEMKTASSRNVPCWYQGCALDSQEDRSVELNGSVKIRRRNEATAGSPEAQRAVLFIVTQFAYNATSLALVLSHMR
jgi:hypothetical protein